MKKNLLRSLWSCGPIEASTGGPIDEKLPGSSAAPKEGRGGVKRFFTPEKQKEV
jgi:hypothetical protein